MRTLKTLFLGHFLLLLFLCVIVCWLRDPAAQHKAPDATAGGQRNVTILLWHWPFSKPYSLQGYVCPDGQGSPSCRLTDDRSLLSSADLVVFHHLELAVGKERLPLQQPRPSRQRWVWLSLEAPENCGKLGAFRDVFNLTMSYRRDADITIPYGGLVRRSSAVSDPPGVPNNKSSLICWVVSNYQSRHRRTKVYQELREVVPVELFGRAAGRTLDPSTLLRTISHCSFYLAFENTESPDYITEKLWRNAFLSRSVPVVLGPPVEHYRAVAPPHSFIHVDEFNSIDALGRFLLELAKDQHRYQQYLAWHQNYTIKLHQDWRDRLCTICPIYNTLPPNKVYKDLSQWAKW